MSNLKYSLMDESKIIEYKLYNNENIIEKLITSRNKYLDNIIHDETIFPISGITAIANGLVNQWDDYDNNQRKTYALAIAKSTDRIVSFINNTLEIAQLSSDQFKLNSQLVNFNELLIEKVQEYQIMYQSKEYLNFVLDLDSSFDIKIDKYLFKRLLDNLVAFIADQAISPTKIKISLKTYYTSPDTTLQGIKTVKMMKCTLSCYTSESTNSLFDQSQFENDIRMKLVQKIIDVHGGKMDCGHDQNSAIDYIALVIAA